MSIAVGDTLPDVQVMTSGPTRPTHVQTGEVLGSGKVDQLAIDKFVREQAAAKAAAAE